MQERTQTKAKTDTNRKRLAIMGVLAAVVIITITSLLTFRQPERSVVAYCKVYKEEAAKLPHEGGDTYQAAMFTSSSNDPHKFAVAFGQLERVAPEEIRQDVKTLQSVFGKIDSDPSQKLTASLSGLGAESNVRDWTQDHCKDK